MQDAINAAEATALRYEVFSYVSLFLLLLFEGIALGLKEGKWHHRCEVLAVFSLGLLLWTDVGSSIYTHRAANLLRDETETQRRRAEEAIKHNLDEVSRHESSIRDAQKRIEMAHTEIERLVEQLRTAQVRLSDTEKRAQILQRLEVSIVVDFATGERVVDDEWNNAFAPTSYAIIAESRAVGFRIASEFVSTRQMSPRLFRIKRTFRATEESGILGRSTRELSQLKRFAFSVAAELTPLRREVGSGDCTVSLKFSVNGVDTPERHYALTSVGLLTGAEEIDIQRQAESLEEHIRRRLGTTR